MIMTDGFSFKKIHRKSTLLWSCYRRSSVRSWNSVNACTGEVSKVFVNDGDENIFELIAVTAADRADFIDLSNVIGTADEITGLARFETNRLAYLLTTSALSSRLTQTHQLGDRQPSKRIRAIAHNAIAQVGSDIIFCHGIHSPYDRQKTV